MLIADLHIHSHYSRATSRDLTPEMLDLWGRRKGLDVIGTGDFTHPAWREELGEKLELVDEGVYALKPQYRVEAALAGPARQPRFVLSGEISSIYKKNGKVRKVHNVVLLPSLEAAEALAHRLEVVGNLHSDGRPILGLDSRDLLEIVLESCPEATFIPAHIWTPHFSLFGAYSGFDTLEECFEDLTPHIHALETGLSSDPPMNWRLSALDDYLLVSNSDAHSPSKLAREANVFDTACTYPALARALDGRDPKGLWGTLEFFPEEGKYHYDGHRNCKVCLKPAETLAAGGRCPVCGKRITVGVLHRVEELADREEGYRPERARAYQSLVPLPEIVGSALGVSATSKRTTAQVETLLRTLGPELAILREVPLEDIERQAGRYVAEGIRRLRRGEVELHPGYDGEYGKIQVLNREEIDRRAGQTSLFGTEVAAELTPGKATWAAVSNGTQTAAGGSPAAGDRAPQAAPERAARDEGRYGLNDEQWRAASAAEPAVAVLAGPGTGKTRTLVYRIIYLVERCGVDPKHITAVTFTNKAAGEMRQRLSAHFSDKRVVKALHIGTFHALCLELLTAFSQPVRLLGEEEALALLRGLLPPGNRSPRAALERISKYKNGLSDEDGELAQAYQAALEREGAADFDDLLLRVLSAFEAGGAAVTRARKRMQYLLVDEFQDINDLQYRLIQAWGKGERSLFVIGDADQAIYGFRGSDAHCFERLAADRPGLVTLRLTRNYRSTPDILSCALPILGHSAPGFLEAQRPQGQPVQLYEAKSAFDEGVYVAKAINALMGGVDMLAAHAGAQAGGAGWGLSDIAVLYRTHRQGELLEQCLLTEGIPYVAVGRDEHLQAPEVRETLAFWDSVLHPEDARAAAASLGWESVGQEAAIAQLTAAWQGEDSLPKVREEPALASWADRWARYAAQTRVRPDVALEAYARERNLLASQAIQRLLHIAVLQDSLESLLALLKLGSEGDIRRSGSRRYAADAVTLMTLHGAKGLEFPVVYLCGLEQGVLPLVVGGECDEAEERRLLYVGMTRAQERLTLTTTPPRSAFLRDIPQGLLQEAQPLRRMPAGRQLSFLP